MGGWLDLTTGMGINVGDYFTKVSSQIMDFVSGLSPGKKLAMVGVGGGILMVIIGMFFWAGDKTFSPLMTNLNPEDSANIIRLLREKNIPFRVDQGGKNISVTPENLDQLRLEIATMGFPENSVVGYEIFDKQSLATTSFVQKVNQKRALEGELMRTIKSISGVKRARVHLAIPTKSTFVEDQKKSTASVVLDLEPGVVLSEKQVYGIGTLVARAVEGMDTTDVVIVDNHGKTLSKNASDSLAQATATQLEYRSKVEGDLEKRVEAILGRVVGEGHVIAKISADLDFAQVNETQTIYDADGSAVRSVQRDTKSMEGSRPTASGPAGALSNTPGQTPGAGVVKLSDTKTSNETTNYEVPQTVRRTQKSVGSIQKLSVAVMMDGKQTRTPAADGKFETKSEAWSAEKLKEFEDIVASTVGLDRKRGDILEIKTMEFKQEDFLEAELVLKEKERKSYIQNIVLYSVIGVTIVLFFLLVVRPFIKWITENTIDSVDTFLPQTLEELERMQKNAILPGLEEAIPVLPDRVDPEKVEGEMIKEKIITLVDSNPHKAALILKDWLHEPVKKEDGAEGDKGGGPGKSKTG
ncbi:MAG: flagellar M-ring protein FliF [Methylotenera sp.]|nr:flagellar M-ring protein FliF [Oligoflexia bacterium]